MDHFGMFVCPETKGPLEDWYSNGADVLYPVLDGIPVLVQRPYDYLRRHGPWDPVAGVAGQKQEILGVAAPDAITPFLDPKDLKVQGRFGDFLLGLGEDTPDRWAVQTAAKVAPAGPAADIGCGVGTMVRRMLMSGRSTVALDLSLDSVMLARALLTGRTSEALVPTHHRGCTAMKVPFPSPGGRAMFAVADAAALPLPAGTIAWAHMGCLLDVLDPDTLGKALISAVDAVGRGGVLTIATAYDGQGPMQIDEPPTQTEIAEVLRELGMQMVEERDRIPHIERNYDRSFTVRLLHCMAWRKP